MSLRAFYGNIKGRSVYAVDVDSMQFLDTIPTLDGPYPVDRVAPDSPLLIASTRNAAGISVIDSGTLAHVRDVSLSHQPRSAKGNGNGLIAVSGRNHPRTTLLRASDFSVAGEFGTDATGPVRDFGGLLASGHEQWIPGSDRFFLLDRVHRTIQLFSANSTAPIWTVNSPTSVHHISPDPTVPGRWCAIAEGGKDALTPPSVMSLQLLNDQVTVVGHRFLPVPSSAQRSAGAHHLDFHPDQRHIYMGSSEGMTYVLDKETLETVALVPTGPGAGHTGFARVGGTTLAMSVNHNADFVTVIDADRHVRLKDVKVTGETYNGTDKLQGHTTWIRGQFFYIMASVEGALVEIDLSSVTVARRCVLPIDPTTDQRPLLMQGVFVPSATTAAESNDTLVGHSCTDCC